MTELKQRIIGALYFIPFIIGTIAGQPYLGVTIGALQVLMAYELAKLIGSSQKAVIMLAALFVLTALSSQISVFGLSPLLLSALLTALCFVIIVVKARFAIALFVTAVLLCLSNLSVLITLPNAVSLLVSLCLIVTAVDIAAYFVGRAVGGKKLAPSISPGKTISGAIGGLIGAMLMAYIVSPYISDIYPNSLILGLVLGILAQAGDLYESAFKRRVGVKDSSNFIPGHGGFLDRFDGYIFIIPLVVAMIVTA